MIYLLLLPYIMFVVGGWLRLKPKPTDEGSPLYQFVVNWFFKTNRDINRSVFKSTTGKTISADARTRGGFTEVLINIIALDPYHCRDYRKY